MRWSSWTMLISQTTRIMSSVICSSSESPVSGIASASVWVASMSWRAFARPSGPGSGSRSL